MGLKGHFVAYHWLAFSESTRAGSGVTPLLLRKERSALKSVTNHLQSTDYFLERAVECERLAGEVMTEENCEILRQLAARWRVLAAEADRAPLDKG